MQNQSQPLPEPLRILFVCAQPEKLSCINLEEEISEIKNWLDSGPFRESFSINTLFSATQNSLRHALLTHTPHILHFSGHGSDSGIILEDESKQAYVFEFEQLAQLLTAFHDNLRMVVLNACNSSHRAEALLQTIEFVVGMNHKILDTSAIQFASALYIALGFNRSIRECFGSGKSALKSRDFPQAHIPMLLSKDGCDPSQTYPLSWVTHQDEDERKRKAADSAVQTTTRPIQLDIILLPPSTNKPRIWRYACNQDEESFESVDERRERLTPDLMWQHLAAETHGAQKGFRGATAPPDIFVMLRDNLILNLYSERTIENIISQVCHAATGTNVYIACDPEVPFNVLYQEKEYQTKLHRWFQMLITLGVTDVIEIPKSHKSRSLTEPESLRKYALDSQHRRRRLRKLVSADDWVVELLPQTKSLKHFLEHFMEGDLSLVNGKNLAVFYDLKPSSLSGLLIKSQKRNSTGKWFIAAYTGSKIDITDLDALWRKESNEKAPESFDGIFEFQGMFEWLYAICRLHLAAQLARQISPNVAGKAMF